MKDAEPDVEVEGSESGVGEGVEGGEEVGEGGEGFGREG